ncbi:SsgA family sporulation/cell division regulator [Amycolatopsis sp. cg5]|uniref:SsgA family sporulation/cell division regulator n=1 Tax=Amycolatopsis sp. cg5 TaxID=3238802 RepID=UPI003524A9BD
MRRHLTHRHQMVFGVRGREITQVWAELCYESREPYALTLSFCFEFGEWVDWVFARELMIEGLSGPVGEGDIRVRPGEPGVLLVELENQHGFVELELDRAVLAEFLERAHVIVPAGQESNWMDFDDELGMLLADGG